MTETNQRRTLEIPPRTILKVVAAGVLVWLWLQLYQLVLVLIVALLLAVTLNPIVKWLERRGLPRWAGATIVSFALLGLVGGFLWITWGVLIEQARYTAQHLEGLERQIRAILPAWARGALAPTGQDVGSTVGPYVGVFLRSALSALVVTGLGFILTAYLLIEADRTHDWLVAFVPKAQRAKVERTLEECETVIFAYVAGNVATSILAFFFVLILAWALNVPAPLFLALLAAVFDFIPVIGFICSSVPAVLLAATVSSGTAVLVLVLYGTYHMVESYLILPMVYGERLKLSNVAVVVAFAVGAELAGVTGALIALPLAAAYPAIERIWLRDELPPETVKEHKAIEMKSA